MRTRAVILTLFDTGLRASELCSLRLEDVPILPNREETLRDCIREGMRDKLWAVAIGDSTTSTYQRLIDRIEDLDSVVAMFDGSAALVKGALLELIREQLGETVGPIEGVGKPPVTVGGEKGGEGTPGTTAAGGLGIIPAPSRRVSRVTIRIDALGIAKTSNLQPYLFTVLQEQDAGAEVTVFIEVDSGAGIPTDVLEKRIVEAFDQLGITVRWETE